MEIVSLHAHFDGTQIQLDEPFEIEPNAELIVTVVKKDKDDDRTAWAKCALDGLERAYGTDEPDYPLDAIVEVNPDYERR